MASRSRPRFFLLIGALAGLACALYSILEDRAVSSVEKALPEGVAAMINGVPLLETDFLLAEGAVAHDSREALSPEDRSHILDRLIEQELLVQRAKELGFDQRDRLVRNVMISAMVQMIKDGAETSEARAGDLEAFYASNQEYFAREDRASIREIRIPVNAQWPEDRARERAEAACAMLRTGELFETVASEFHVPGIMEIPRASLPPSELRNYIGPTPTKAAFSLDTGEVSDPIRGGTSYHVLVMDDRVRGEVPPLNFIKEAVITEMQRRKGEKALREYIDSLVEVAEIQRRPL